MPTTLNNRAIAILATDGFEQSELLEPQAALQAAGAEVRVISQKSGEIQGMEHHDKGRKVPVDQTLDAADPAAYDGLVLPGGVVNPDTLRIDPKAMNFIGHFVRSGKPIAAICHGPWTLIDSGAVKGKRMTSWPSLKADLTNAGAHWVDEPCVRDGMLVTSRKPDDLPIFNKAIVEMFGETGAQIQAAE